MKINIRTANLAQDFQRVAELISADAPEVTRADELIHEYRVEMEGRTLRHAVAINTENEIIGFSFAGHYPSMDTYQYYANVVVDPAHRQQRIGTALWDEMAGYLHEQHADRVLCTVYEGEPAHFHFAQSRGFEIQSHQLRAVLDLDHFDDSEFENLAQSLELAGIRLTSFADVEQTEEHTRQLYDINGIAALDDPASDGSYIAYDNWKKVILGGSWFQPAGQMIALDGDKFVALSAITYDVEENKGFTLISGVAPSYRNRKIMQALKHQAISYAASFGANQVVTELSTANAPMRAINRKLGFVEEPGAFEMAASLDGGPKLCQS